MRGDTLVKEGEALIGRRVRVAHSSGVHTGRLIYLKGHGMGMVEAQLETALAPLGYWSLRGVSAIEELRDHVGER